MFINELIFSDKPMTRISRHLLFWLLFAVHVFFFRFYVMDLKSMTYTSTYIARLKVMLLFLPVSMFYAYFSIYFLLPRYILTERYVKLFGIIILMTLVLIPVSYCISILFNVKLAWDFPSSRTVMVRQFDFTFNNGIAYPLAVSAFAIGIKMSKNFYTQQKQNTALVIEKINADVQMLKSQVHARFLFHSLESIYSDLICGGAKSPEMVLRLSELLNYILYENDKLMPLEKELLLLNNYIALEKISWGDRLHVTNTGQVDAGKIFIEPLLLLPVAEYVFDNLDKNNIDRVSLRLAMNANTSFFYFRMDVDGYDPKGDNAFENAVHIRLVQKRLEAQYPGKHKLTVSKEQNTLSIALALEPAEDRMPI